MYRENRYATNNSVLHIDFVPRNNGCFSIITADGLTVCLGFGENVILRENKGGNIWPANTITFGAAKEKPEVPGRPETRASAQPACAGRPGRSYSSVRDRKCYIPIWVINQGKALAQENEKRRKTMNRLEQ